MTGGALPIRIAMWSGPRNISTAMMRAFGNRPDTAVIDEPFYAAYLAATGIDHPMRAETLASQPHDWRDVARDLIGKVPQNRAIFYQKHMTHHMLPDFGVDWMAHCRNAFLIRHPARVLASYHAKRQSVTLDDIGIARQVALFRAVCDRTGEKPPIIDADDLLAAPEPALHALCAALHIPFLPCMLHWPAGPRDTDGAWAPSWYHAVNESTAFGPPSPVPPPFDAALRRMEDAATPLYNELFAHRLLSLRAAPP